MEILKKFSMLLLIVASSIVLWNCEGPAGKDGIAGKDGTNGTDGVAKCGTCHADTSDVNLKFNQYDLSIHNTGIIYEEEAGRANCSSCHTGDGFVAALKSGTPSTATGTSKIDCKTCHPIHDKYTKADFAIRVTAPVKLLKTGAEYDFKTGNLCATCHQARPYNDIDAADTTFKTTGTSTYTRYGPHYGTPANVFAMKGLNAITGPETVPTTNVHANLAQGCVTCHMGKLSTNPAAGGHTFLMTAAQLVEIEACKSCHPAADFFTKIPKSKEIATMLKETRDTLLARGWIDISQTTTESGAYQVLGEYFATSKAGVKMTKEQVHITLNYLYIAKDRSMGAHNPTYVYALVKNGLAKLKQ